MNIGHLVIYIHIYIIFMSVGWDVKWCPVPRITTPLDTQKTVSLDFDENRLVRAARET